MKRTNQNWIKLWLVLAVLSVGYIATIQAHDLNDLAKLVRAKGRLLVASDFEVRTMERIFVPLSDDYNKHKVSLALVVDGPSIGGLVSNGQVVQAERCEILSSVCSDKSLAKIRIKNSYIHCVNRAKGLAIDQKIEGYVTDLGMADIQPDAVKKVTAKTVAQAMVQTKFTSLDYLYGGRTESNQGMIIPLNKDWFYKGSDFYRALGSKKLKVLKLGLGKQVSFVVEKTLNLKWHKIGDGERFYQVGRRKIDIKGRLQLDEISVPKLREGNGGIDDFIGKRKG